LRRAQKAFSPVAFERGEGPAFAPADLAVSNWATRLSQVSAADRLTRRFRTAGSSLRAASSLSYIAMAVPAWCRIRTLRSNAARLSRLRKLMEFSHWKKVWLGPRLSTPGTTDAERRASEVWARERPPAAGMR
jgi:hypothetical protein